MTELPAVLGGRLVTSTSGQLPGIVLLLDVAEEVALHVEGLTTGDEELTAAHKRELIRIGKTNYLSGTKALDAKLEDPQVPAAAKGAIRGVRDAINTYWQCRADFENAVSRLVATEPGKPARRAIRSDTEIAIRLGQRIDDVLKCLEDGPHAARIRLIRDLASAANHELAEKGFASTGLLDALANESFGLLDKFDSDRAE